MGQSPSAPETAMEPDSADEHEDESQENGPEGNDKVSKEMSQTTTTPEFLEWSEQVQAKLRLLEQSMDPLAARTQYNFENSPIYRAPDEILLMAMRHLDDQDPAALFCLRQVSRR